MPKRLAALLVFGAIASTFALIKAPSGEGSDQILLTALGVGGFFFLGVFFYAVIKSRR